MTKSTLTSVEELRASFDTIVSQGYSIECEEFVVGLIALAVPVRGSDGGVTAAIAMHAPLTHVSPDEVMKKLPTLQATIIFQIIGEKRLLVGGNDCPIHGK